jgi:hypothetical protein
MPHYAKRQNVGGKRKVKIHKKTVYYHGGCRLIWQ